jgi:hypothetical protein
MTPGSRGKPSKWGSSPGFPPPPTSASAMRSVRLGFHPGVGQGLTVGLGCGPQPPRGPPTRSPYPPGTRDPLWEKGCSAGSRLTSLANLPPAPTCNHPTTYFRFRQHLLVGDGIRESGRPGSDSPNGEGGEPHHRTRWNPLRPTAHRRSRHRSCQPTGMTPRRQATRRESAGGLALEGVGLGRLELPTSRLSGR